jgi:hypothetical protein
VLLEVGDDGFLGAPVDAVDCGGKASVGGHRQEKETAGYSRFIGFVKSYDG